MKWFSVMGIAHVPLLTLVFKEESIPRISPLTGAIGMWENHGVVHYSKPFTKKLFCRSLWSHTCRAPISNDQSP